MTNPWSRVGTQPRVDTYGLRKTAHVFGAVALDDADFTFLFADVFNGSTFHEFLRKVVDKYAPRKVFMVIDNAPSHWLDDAGKVWLKANPDKVELHRLPPYSPEFMPQQGVWKATRKLATHNRFYATTVERDAALTEAFQRFETEPSLIDAHVAVYRR